MACAFLIIGLIVLVAAIRGKQTDLWNLVRSDFTGSNNFFYWVLAVILLVALGTFKPIRPITDAFLGLIILVILIGNKDLVGSFTQQVKAGTS